MYKTGLHGAEAICLAECLHNGGEKEEQDAPCEADPEREEDDDRLGKQHFGRPHERDLEHLYDGRLFELGFGVDGSAGLFAELLSAFLENDVAARFFEDEPEDRNQGGVVYYLNIEDPVWIQYLMIKLWISRWILTIATGLVVLRSVCEFAL